MKPLDLVHERRWFFIVSGAIFIASLILLGVFRLRPGIEFTSGTTILVEFENAPSQEDLRSVFTDLGHEEARIQVTGDREFLIRTRELEVPDGGFTEIEPEDAAPDIIGPAPVEPLGTLDLGAEGATGNVALYSPADTDPCVAGDESASLAAGTEVTVIELVDTCADGTVYRVQVAESIGYIAEANTRNFVPVAEAPDVTQNAGERTVIEQRLHDEFGAFNVREFASVSAVVSEVAVRNTAVAVVVSSLFIMAYVAFAFSSLPRPFRYGACAIIAVLHDVFAVLGIFALLGAVFGLEVNLMFVTGLLTVIGFSVHDTIVVFDRIRENLKQAPTATLAENVNSALLQTMARSLNTGMTVILTIGAMLVLGGSTIREFLLVILIGIIFGTYSSIGIASQLLVSWEEGDFGRLFHRNRTAEQPAA